MATVSTRTAIAGVTITSDVTRSEELESSFAVDLAAGLAGTLTTRTDDDTGVVTVASGHGITTSDTVAVFWAGGSRHGLAVSASAATTITVDTGAGDVLPSASTALVICKESTHDLALTGDDLVILAVSCPNRANINFRAANDSSLLRYDMAAKEGRIWFSGHGVTNPLAGDVVASVVLANGGTTAAQLRIGAMSSTNA